MIRLFKSRILATLGLWIFGLSLTTSAPSYADFKVCNDTKNLVGVAIGYRGKRNWVMEGWWRIPANVCATVRPGNLKSRYFYLFAEDAVTLAQWRGPVFMCTTNDEFKIRGLKNCFARGYERTGFFEVDTGNQKSWQVRLSEADQTPKDQQENK